MGAVEIKAPGKQGVGNKAFAGQLYDYLRILSDIFGKMPLSSRSSLFFLLLLLLLLFLLLFLLLLLLLLLNNNKK